MISTMTFRTKDKIRKFVLRSGVGAAPFVITFHACPISDESPLATPPEHVEQEIYDPLETSGIEMFTSAPSSMTANSMVRIDAEHVRIGNQILKIRK